MHVKLTIVAGPARGKTFFFDRPDRLLFGRAADARISLPDDGHVSRNHFLLEIAPAGCKLSDLGSKNGVFVNGVRYGGRKPPEPGVVQAPGGAKEAVLRDGDEISVGDTRMRLEIRLEATVPANSVAFAEAATQGGALEPTFAGYRIEGELGRGGMGVVYRGRRTGDDRAVAIKTMLPHVATMPQHARAFLREVDLTRQLRHANIVEVLDSGFAEGTFYCVLELVEGMDLAAHVRASGGRLSLREAAPLMLGILNGLGHAHRTELDTRVSGGEARTFKGVVHRDLKPQNILLARADPWVAKVADFGLAKSFEAAGLTDMTTPGQVAGTPFYWPREQITHYRFLSPATDVFSIATVFYEMLTGRWPRDGVDELLQSCSARDQPPGIAEFMWLFMKYPPLPIRERDDTVPARVARVLDRALRETEVPMDETEMRATLGRLRYPDASAFADALREALVDDGVV